MGRRESRRTQKTSAGTELVGSRCALWDAASRPRPRQAGPAILTGCEPTRTTCLPYEIAQSTAVAQVVLPSRARNHADECALLNDLYCAALVLPELYLRRTIQQKRVSCIHSARRLHLTIAARSTHHASRETIRRQQVDPAGH